MKRNYIQPSVETVDMIASNMMNPVSVNAPLNNGGGTDIVDPSQGL